MAVPCGVALQVAHIRHMRRIRHIRHKSGQIQIKAKERMAALCGVVIHTAYVIIQEENPFENLGVRLMHFYHLSTIYQFIYLFFIIIQSETPFANLGARLMHCCASSKAL